LRIEDDRLMNDLTDDPATHPTNDVQAPPNTPRPPIGGGAEPDDQDDIVYPSTIAFIIVHLACFAAFWTGLTWQSIALCAALYWLRIFFIGAGYHRYFSHRAYSTSRAFQLILALGAQSTTQKSVLWWATQHRHHHLHSDTARDLHSPRQKGFWYSHVGWIFARRQGSFELVKIADFAKFPELMWLNRFEQLPSVALAVICYLVAGWPGLVVGFFWSTVLVYHGTFCINSLAHVRGRKRYVTGDDSRNNWLLAVFTMGEGWHNNHHAYQSSVRQGFKWWEYDCTYYVLKLLSWLRVVWDLKTPPLSVMRNEHGLGSRVIGRAAAQLADSFNADRIAAAVSSALEGSNLTALLERLSAAQHRAADVLAGLSLPHMPTRDEVLARATTMFARTRSMDDIVERAYELVLDSIAARLCGAAAALPA
jgi:stearoyl-CoA desaturase (delta-9 desaturase)